MLCLCIMYMVSSWHFRSCLGSAWRGEEGQPHQFLVRASSKFSSFSLIEMLFWRTSFIGYIYYFTNLKIVWENFVFYFCAEVAIFSKNIFICKGWTLKKIILEGRGFRGGMDEKMRRMRLGRDIVVVGLPPLSWPLVPGRYNLFSYKKC